MKHYFMGRYLTTGFLLCTILLILFATSLFSASYRTMAQDAKPTPKEGSDTLPTPQKPVISYNSSKVKPVVTFDELLDQYPDLEAYLEKLDAIEPEDLYTDIDYKELYQHLVTIHKDHGSTGVAIFVEDSYIAYDLDIPLAFFDIVVQFEQGGIDKVIEQANALDLVDEDELVAYLAIYPPEELDALKAELEEAGITMYEFDDEEEVLDIGIPLQLLRDLKTPEAMLEFLATLGNMERVDELFAPETELDALQVN